MRWIKIRQCEIHCYFLKIEKFFSKKIYATETSLNDQIAQPG